MVLQELLQKEGHAADEGGDLHFNFVCGRVASTPPLKEHGVICLMHLFRVVAKDYGVILSGSEWEITFER